MNSPSRSVRRLGFASAAAIATAIVLAVAQSRSTQPSPSPAPGAPTVRQLELVHAERFTVQQPYVHRYRADTPLVSDGWLLVLAGDPAWLQVRQTRMPVLYVGAQTAERVNTGQQSGKLVVLVPGDFALQNAPIFLGGVALPEELRQLDIDAELAGARTAGAVAPTAATLAKVVQPGRTFATDYELRQRAIDLVEQFSPVEKDLIAGWRVPLVK